MKQSSALELREHLPGAEVMAAPARPAEFALAAFDLLSRHRHQLVRITVAALLALTILAFLIPKRYEAVARLMPPDQTTGLSGVALSSLSAKVGDSVTSMAGDLLGVRTTGATMVAILTSRTVRDDLINRFDLRKVYYRKRYDDTRSILNENTSIAEDKKSGIITISVEDKDEQRAVALAKAYVDELNARVSQLSTSSARREREFLEGRLEKIKQDLDESSLKLSEFSSKNRTFDPAVQGKAMLEAASTLQGQLIAAETELSGLQQVYGPENARVRSASARVSELRSKLRKLAGISPDGSTPSADTVANQPYPSLQQLPILGNTYYDLYRRTKINEAVYEALTRQYELAKVQEAKEIPSVKVLDEPVLPEHKSWPPRLVIISLGTFLFASLCLAGLLIESAVSRLDPHDPTRVLLTRAAGVAVRPYKTIARKLHLSRTP